MAMGKRPRDNRARHRAIGHVTRIAFVCLTTVASRTDPPPASRASSRCAACAKAAIEWWLIKGRRCGGTRFLSLVATYLGTCVEYRLAPGEKGIIMLLSAEKRQARLAHSYIDAFIRSVPELEAMVVSRTAWTIELSNHVIIEDPHQQLQERARVHRARRLCDEIGFWETSDTSANPDKAVLDAVRPAMGTIEGALLIAFSSPWARRGELWNTHQRYFGRDDCDDVFVWQSDSRTMNSELNPAVIERAYAEDPNAADSEWGGNFRRDIETYCSIEALEAATVKARLELAPQQTITYSAFGDAAGGSGGDSFTVAIGYKQGEDVILAVLREYRPPFSPDVVVRDIAGLLNAYGVRQITADKYAGDWPKDRFAAYGIAFKTAELTKSELYLAFLPLLNSGRVELLDHPKMLKQFERLERRRRPGGRDIVDHPPGAGNHDDLSNAVAGMASVVTERRKCPIGVARLPEWM